MRSLIFIASPFRRLRDTSGDETEYITFPHYMDHIQEPVIGCEADTCLPRLFPRTRVLIVRQLIEKDFTGVLEPYAVA
jgi:hypothetical protein